MNLKTLSDMAFRISLSGQKPVLPSSSSRQQGQAAPITPAAPIGPDRVSFSPEARQLAEQASLDQQIRPDRLQQPDGLGKTVALVTATVSPAVRTITIQPATEPVSDDHQTSTPLPTGQRLSLRI